jgi:hypothetical protein
MITNGEQIGLPGGENRLHEILMQMMEKSNKTSSEEMQPSRRVLKAGL